MNPYLPSEECSDKNEGSVEVVETGNPKYGYDYHYYQCKDGNWEQTEPWAACDTAGVAVGDTCEKIVSKKGFFSYGREGEIVELAFIYAGDGTWKELLREQPQNVFPDCSDFKDGDETLYCPPDEVCDDMKHYVCKEGTWTLAEEQK